MGFQELEKATKPLPLTQWLLHSQRRPVVTDNAFWVRTAPIVLVQGSDWLWNVISFASFNYYSRLLFRYT